MKTDKLFYHLFQSLPDLFFTLTGLDYPSNCYEFKSIEVKELKFTIDGVFIPKEKNLPIIFTEVQFQKDKDFYSRLFTEVFIYLRQYKPENPWQTVVIFPNKTIDVGNIFHYQKLEPHLTRIYLRENLPEATTDISLQLLKMIISNSEQKAINIARKVIESEPSSFQQTLLYELIETIILYRCPSLTAEELKSMIHFSKDYIEQSPLYQEALAKGLNQGEYKKALQMVFKLLKHRFGNLGETQENQIKTLSEQQLDFLAESLLDFKNSDDLTHWLNSNTNLLN